MFLSIGLFALSAGVIAFIGTHMTRLADTLADRTRLGEAVAGGVLLGMSTSLSGTVTSISAALEGYPSLAFSNATGGIAVQTVFLVVADLAYRGVNLEHAAADAKNLLQSALLVLLLAVALAAYLMPPVTIWSVHPASLLLVALYAFGVRSSVELAERPTWRPERTSDTRAERPDETSMRRPLGPLLLLFAGLALILGLAGFTIARTAARISSELGISQTTVGTLLTATATSLPELVTTLAAVRRGALQMAVGGIVGGNTFDVVFLSLSDVAYRQGSIYQAVDAQDAFVLVTAIIMTALLLMGLILRDRRGIGFEGFGILIVYATMIVIQLAGA